MSQFAKKLRELRVSRNVPATRLSEALGFCRNAVTNAERTGNVTADFANAAAVYFDAPELRTLARQEREERKKAARLPVPLLPENRVTFTDINAASSGVYGRVVATEATLPPENP